MKFRCALFLATLLRATAADPALPADHAERMSRGLERFRRHVRPVLVEQCLKCHGGEKTKGELDLATRDGLLKGGADGPVVTIYHAATSRLMALLQHTQDPHMPAKGEKLPEATIAQIAAWIDDGAPYDQALVAGREGSSAPRNGVSNQARQWWAFQPLKEVPPPKLPTPLAQASPVDAFLTARLQEKSLSLNPPADRRTLLRRASFDLLGLPPTPGDVEAFLSDPSPDAWAAAVARLLDNPHYGERWARHWLDVARFAESSGFEHDYDRPSAYHYRDFVIKALNSDLPYDDFVRWQLAGDEFEPENPLALMATGFLGAGVFPTQITANEVERVRYDALDDMLATTGTAMLGLTVGCARCHDHKFDPIPAHDYYRLLATFTTTVRSDIELDLQPEVTRRMRAQHADEHRPLVQAVKAYEAAELPAKFNAWLAAGAPLEQPAAWESLAPVVAKSQGGATLKQLDDGSYLAEGKNPDFDTYTFVAESSTSDLRAIRLEALSHSSLPKGGPGRAENGNLGLSRIRVFASPLAGGDTHEIRLRNPRGSFEQNTGSLALAAALDEDPKTGWAVDPQFGTNHTAVFEFTEPVGFSGGTRFEVRLEFNLNTRHNIGRPRLGLSTVASPPLAGDALPSGVGNSLRRVQSGAGDALTPEERRALLAWWRTSEPGWRSLQNRVEDHARQAPAPRLSKVLICGEGYPAVRMHTQGGDFLPETHFLNRGSPDLKRGVATPGFLQVLLREPGTESRWESPLPAGARFSGRRRALAQWLTDPRAGAGHLLARVMVNRLWQHHFGQGLVATPNDFGAQGTKPSHPELLDWLASELIRGGWRLKPLHQRIMLSAAYQQNGAADATRRAADPLNLLVSRQSPRRLEAEAIRDSLLFVSGALDPTLYGPGTLDSASRRRSIYFTVKRSQMVPAMQAFDAPEPLASQGTRPTTTVAPQALWLMNSAPVRTWAAVFARRIDPTADQPAGTSVDQAYQLALNRPPTATERADGIEFLEQQQARYPTKPSTAARAEALTDFAQVILSLNEFIYAP